MPQQSSASQSTLIEYLDSTSLYQPKVLESVGDLSEVAGDGVTIAYGEVSDGFKPNRVDSIVENSINFGLVSIISLFFVLIAIYHFKSFRQIVKTFFMVNAADRIVELLNVNIDKFINLGSLLFSISVAFLCKNFVEVYMQQGWWISTLSLLVLATIFLFIVARYSVIYCMKRVAKSEIFFDKFNILCKSYFSVCSIIITPVFLILSQYSFNELDRVVYIVAILSSLVVIGYVVISVSFFFRRNISFLEYILYLCSAEIVPATLIIKLFYDNFVVM